MGGFDARREGPPGPPGRFYWRSLSAQDHDQGNAMTSPSFSRPAGDRDPASGGRPPRTGKRYLSLEPLILWSRMDRPIHRPDVFGRRSPLELEIGYGNGEYLTRHAQAHPDRDFIGLELSWPSTKRALRRIAQRNLSNIRLIELDAVVALQRLFRPRSLDRIYALFPPPWPKERHYRRRLFSTAFLGLMNSRLQDHGQGQIVTDYRPLADWILSQVPGTGLRATVETTPARFMTKYERKWQEAGQAVFYEIRLEKEQHIHVPLTEDISLNTYRIKSFDPERFHPENEFGPITVKFKDYLYDPKRRRAMARAFVTEDQLIQEFWIEAAEEGELWHIHLARGSHVVPSQGVQRALDLARDAAQNSAAR